MPAGAPRPCTQPGCRALVSKGSRCPAHPYPQRRTRQAQEYNKLYNTARWRKARRVWLNQHPLCVECEAIGRVVTATVVDHITPHKGDTALFWDSENNWQSMCKRHHDRKTAREDGGYGR